MKTVDAGPAYEQLASLAIEHAGSDFDGIYVFAEAESGYFGAGVYRHAGDKVYQVPIGDEFLYAVMDLWEKLPTEQRWSIMHMDIEGGQFDARFEFGEDALDDYGDEFDDREDAAVAARFGNKEIIYPDNHED